jgi:hypothetical protein
MTKLNLPVPWMAVVVFSGAYLLAALVHWTVMRARKVA